MKTTFSSSKPLVELIQKQKAGLPVGIYSICSAHKSVLQAAMSGAMKNDEYLLIEATCNQVNQFGGYTGMTPLDFANYVADIAQEKNFPTEKIILGSDHLGINPWQRLPIDDGLKNARDMVCAYAAAGFSKIHIDMTMPASDDKLLPLSAEIIAERSAILCQAVERTVSELGLPLPVYVIGSEVPSPGGAKEAVASIAVTAVEDARDALLSFQKVYHQKGLDDAFSRTIALVVQPGVEFNDTEVFDYVHEKAVPLIDFIEKTPGIVYEAHSTDYQNEACLSNLVKDHFGILKVGPELTYAFREAVFLLAQIEKEMAKRTFGMINESNIIEKADQAMLEQPSHWDKFYHGTSAEMAFSRKYSYSDRIRYYWLTQTLSEAYVLLITNLNKTGIPSTLISQYFNEFYYDVRNGSIKADAESLIFAYIRKTLDRYRRACGIL